MQSAVDQVVHLLPSGLAAEHALEPSGEGGTTRKGFPHLPRHLWPRRWVDSALDKGRARQMGQVSERVLVGRISVTHTLNTG